MTHSYKRNGTTTLFAALDVLRGKVIGQCMLKHRAREFLRFLRRLDNLSSWWRERCCQQNLSGAFSMGYEPHRLQWMLTGES
jgi:hypothetical protein